jgi:hypothetical protein
MMKMGVEGSMELSPEDFLQAITTLWDLKKVIS